MAPEDTDGPLIVDVRDQDAPVPDPPPGKHLSREDIRRMTAILDLLLETPDGQHH